MHKDKKFEVFRLFFGILGMLLLEGVLLQFLPFKGFEAIIILPFSLIGAIVSMYVSIQAIEKINSRIITMLVFLFIIIFGFITFFAFEYWYLLTVEPASFPAVKPGMLDLLLHSTMVFVLNPIYLPATPAGNGLVLINTLSSLCIVIFILQNISQLHHLRRKDQI